MQWVVMKIRQGRCRHVVCLAAGETPTEKTGPSYDHSTLTKDGKRRNEMFLLRRKTNNTNQVKTVQLT